jgi:hypothetical protein
MNFGLGYPFSKGRLGAHLSFKGCIKQKKIAKKTVYLLQVLREMLNFRLELSVFTTRSFLIA